MCVCMCVKYVCHICVCGTCVCCMCECRICVSEISSVHSPTPTRISHMWHTYTHTHTHTQTYTQTHSHTNTHASHIFESAHTYSHSHMWHTYTRTRAHSQTHTPTSYTCACVQTSERACLRANSVTTNERRMCSGDSVLSCMSVTFAFTCCVFCNHQ